MWKQLLLQCKGKYRIGGLISLDAGTCNTQFVLIFKIWAKHYHINYIKSSCNMLQKRFNGVYLV